MTTDQLENAIAFAKSEKYDGDVQVILAQAKMACRTLTKEIERLHETNQRLNRRAQKMESTHHDHWWDEYQRGYQEGLKGSSEIKHLQWIAQKHGEKNAKLKAEIKQLRDTLITCRQYVQARLDDNPNDGLAIAIDMIVPK